MTLVQAFILGLIQGLTEFIPVSSSGHLVIAHHALGVFDNGLAFDVALHAGTLIALIAYFWKDLIVYAKALFIKSKETRLTWLLIAATIPAAIIGFLLESSAESVFRSGRLVGMTMLIFGLIMIGAEEYYKRRKQHTELEEITTKQAMTMGFTQAIAVIPGVSRSGSTITAGLFAGLDRVAATRFSFLLGIPITAGAVLKVFTEPGIMEQFQQEKAAVIVGVLTALVSSLFAIRFMLRFLSKHGLYIFGYYRIVLGLMLLLIFTLH
jgi:undecaprenyl-diphosphatase